MSSSSLALLAVLLLFLVVSSSDANVDISLRDEHGTTLSWEVAPKEEISKHYFAYEVCVLEQANLLNDQNKSQTIHNIEGCLHLVDDRLSKLNKRCWLGSRQQRIDNGICIYPRQFIYCRRVHQRPGLFSFWKGLDKVKVLGHRGQQEYLKSTGELNTLNICNITSINI
jgi:hypothetical protein